MTEQQISILVLACGFACIAGAVMNWNWFFENWQTKYIIRAIGRSMTRRLYGGLGVILVVLGLLRIGGAG